jgi:hypothetical protein
MIMAAKKDESQINNEDGQALIEFLIFLPFMLMMYSVSMSISNAINASINQQKIARSYFYYRLANNSTFPRPRRDDIEPSQNWNVFGFQIMGWSEKLLNENPVAPCFKFAVPLGDGEDDKCEDTYSGSSTQFIRVKTVYGVCGATYIKQDNYNIPYPAGALNYNGGNLKHCEIIE